LCDLQYQGLRLVLGFLGKPPEHAIMYWILLQASPVRRIAEQATIRSVVPTFTCWNKEAVDHVSHSLA
jgi:hypothetical protein